MSGKSGNGFSLKVLMVVVPLGRFLVLPPTPTFYASTLHEACWASRIALLESGLRMRWGKGGWKQMGPVKAPAGPGYWLWLAEGNPRILPTLENVHVAGRSVCPARLVWLVLSSLLRIPFVHWGKAFDSFIFLGTVNSFKTLPRSVLLRYNWHDT